MIIDRLSTSEGESGFIESIWRSSSGSNLSEFLRAADELRFDNVAALEIAFLRNASEDLRCFGEVDITRFLSQKKMLCMRSW